MSFIATPISSFVYNASGIGAVTTYLFITLLVVCIPSILLIAPFTEPPKKSCCGKRKDEAEAEAAPEAAPAPAAETA